MKLTKVTYAHGNTFVVLKANNELDYCTITIAGRVNVEMSNKGAALMIRQEGPCRESNT